MKTNYDVLLEKLKNVSEYTFKPFIHLNRQSVKNRIKSLRIKSTVTVLPNSQFSSTRISSLSLQGKKTWMSIKDVKQKKAQLFKKTSNDLPDEVFLAEDYMKILKLTPCKQFYKKPQHPIRCRLRKEKQDIQPPSPCTIHIQTQIYEEEEF